jgi:hypothetical protein
MEMKGSKDILHTAEEDISNLSDELDAELTRSSKWDVDDRLVKDNWVLSGTETVHLAYVGRKVLKMIVRRWDSEDPV